MLSLLAFGVQTTTLVGFSYLNVSLSSCYCVLYYIHLNYVPDG